jgi:predicted unusual protein kinase regulating ubiquinone biosynthesis (AarF/ABC1/UbiB family)
MKHVSLSLSQKSILCVKLFQAIALNNNIISEETNNELKVYTDNAPYDVYDIDIETLFSLNAKYNLLCSKDCNYSKPYRSGMISLVYKMVNEKGESRIVKLKRMNIEKKLKQSIQELRFIVSILSFLPYFNTLDISTSLNKNISLLKQQLNFQEEVQNMKEAYNNCVNLSYLRIPQVYHEITQAYDNVIVMELLEGVSIQDVAQEDYDIYAKLIVKYGFVSLLLHGVTHGDLHGGNILFIKTKQENTLHHVYQLGIIDFGIVLRLHEKFKNSLLEIFIHLFTKPSIELAREILTASIEPEEIFRNLPKFHTDKILTFTSNIIHDTIHVAKRADQLKVYEFLTTFYSYLNKNNLKNLGLKVNENVVKIQMALGMCNGLNMTLCKRDIISLADVVLKEMFHLDLLLD